MFMTLGLRTWRVAPDVDFNWVNKKQLTVTTYTRTTFGLFTISFNGGLNVRTWSRITAITCSNLDAIKPVATAQSSLMVSPSRSVHPVSSVRQWLPVALQQQVWRLSCDDFAA
ncbi:MAG: hypothetical protein KVP17_003516 [Porospora cf. gigantea B]|uniref:uncharacterized protein n=1 Tax=Porospora cf. gigantea B TaxID=2853592 RepID=UPI003571D92C|nr:MAG: hypothetical protein KVP17_003516 [Porospora cf. gigantea B]